MSRSCSRRLCCRTSAAIHTSFIGIGVSWTRSWWYAAAYRQLRVQQTPIPMNDVWIAALVLQHNLRLHDRDKHFDHLPQIVRV